MLKKLVLGATALASTAVIVPSAAEAQYYGGYSRPYYGQSYDPYYNQGYYNQGYDRGYYGQSYDRRYYDGRRYGRRCGSGTTGMIIGGAGGALVGREIERSGRYYRRGGTTGAIVGGALGALLGRSIARNSC